MNLGNESYETRINVLLKSVTKMPFKIFLTSVYGLTIYHNTLDIICVCSLEIFRGFCFGSVCIYMYVCVVCV